MLLSKSLVAKRLKRFEALTGINYPEGEFVVEIWQGLLKDYNEERFNMACDYIEQSKLKWHILPTPTDLLEVAPFRRQL